MVIQQFLVGQVDFIGPSYSPIIAGVEAITVPFGVTFDPLEGVTGWDDLEGDITHRLVVTGSVDYDRSGQYVLWYSLTNARNLTTVVQRTVTVMLSDETVLYTDITAVSELVAYTFGDDLSLPIAGALGSVFTNWTSSHPELIAHDGTYVAMPETTTEVTFTGTATFGEATGVVTVTVDALAPMTMAEAILVPDGRPVIVEGVVQSHIQANRGFFIYDGTGHMYVRDLDLVPHPNEGPPPYAIGDVIYLIGYRESFAGIPQITAVKHIETTDNVYDLPENIGEVDIADIGAGLYPAGTVVTLIGVVEVIRGNFTDVRLVDGDAFVQIHHVTSFLPFLDFEGELVTIEVTVFQWEHRNNFVAFFGTATDITVIHIDEDWLASVAVNAIHLGDLTGVHENLELPLVFEHPEGWEATFAWTSDNEEVITPSGVVTRTLETVTVILTVTATVGEGSAVRTFEVTVLDETYIPDGMTVAEALLKADGSEVLLQGVVTSYPEFAGGFFIQDSDGTAIYVRAAAGFGEVEIGNLIVVKGRLETFTNFGNHQRRIAEPVLLKNDGEAHNITVRIGQSLGQIVNNYPHNSSMRFRVYDVVIHSTAANTIFLETSEDRLVRFDTRFYGQHILDLYEIGDTIPWVEFTVYDISFDNLRAEGLYFPELTNEQIETLLGLRINLPEEVTADLTLPASLTIAGVNHVRGADVFPIHWSSDNEAITNQGIVTRPAVGEDDVHVMLTATISAYAVVDFHVTVLAEVDTGGVVTYVQTFDEAFTAGTTAYNTVTEFTDANGFDWFILGRREMSGIDGKSIILGNADNESVIRVTAQGGIGSFSIDLVRAFSNQNLRSVELFVNGVSYGSFDVAVDHNNVQTFVVENINVEGEVVIELFSTSPGLRGGMFADNFTWTTYDAE